MAGKCDVRDLFMNFQNLFHLPLILQNHYPVAEHIYGIVADLI